MPQDPISGITLPHTFVLSAKLGLKVILVLTVSITRSPLLIIGVAVVSQDPSASSITIMPNSFAARLNAEVLKIPVLAGLA